MNIYPANVAAIYVDLIFYTVPNNKLFIFNCTANNEIYGHM